MSSIELRTAAKLTRHGKAASICRFAALPHRCLALPRAVTVILAAQRARYGSGSSWYANCS
jgi:hypothetical protein